MFSLTSFSFGQMSDLSIPKTFYSCADNVPFAQCIECGVSLLSPATEYVIEKIVKNHEEYALQETLFDFAICMNCIENEQKKISTHSMKSMNDYFHEKLEKIESPRSFDGYTKESLGRCVLTQRKREECKEYRLVAHCKGSMLSSTHPPYLLSDEASDELTLLLSTQTREGMDDFFFKHFSPDASLLAPTPKVLFV